MYIPVYLFAIWDSYRTTMDMNRVNLLAEQENHRFNSFSLGALEINYLDKRNPVLSIIWSLFIPGLGQLYIHRVLTAFFIIIGLVVFYYFSHFQEAVLLLLLGNVQEATSVLKPEWLLFLPSHYGFALYDSYVNTVENNKLFDKELREYLKENYQNNNFHIKKIKK